MDYTQFLNTDGNSVKNQSIGQTRGGNDEWITPVTLWELDTSTGLYMPPGTSTNPKAPRVVINGRKVEVAAGSFDQTLSVGADTGTTISVAPAAGELWRIKMLRIIFPAPVGATSGTHYFDVGFGIAGSGYSLMRFDSNYNNAISIYNNVAIADIATPFDELTQFLAINSLIATNAKPLQFYYRNSTDAAQTGTLTLRIAREVEYIA